MPQPRVPDPEETTPPPRTANEHHLEAVIAQLQPKIVSLVEREPMRDIHFYIMQIESDDMKLAAPMAFKRMRMRGALKRIRSDGGNFLWSVR